MYETNKNTVPLGGEVEFMRNYIELMKLRCNEQTSVNYQLSTDSELVEVAPLLFVSLIEDRSGSGIGIENTRRRLELMYADRYEWEQTLEDNIYHVMIKLKL